MTRAYSKERWGIEKEKILPQGITIIGTQATGAEELYRQYAGETETGGKEQVLNKGAQFAVDAAGNIYSFMPDNALARQDREQDVNNIYIVNLAAAHQLPAADDRQVQADKDLIRLLRLKYNEIEQVDFRIGPQDQTLTGIKKALQNCTEDLGVRIRE